MTVFQVNWKHKENYVTWMEHKIQSKNEAVMSHTKDNAK